MEDGKEVKFFSSESHLSNVKHLERVNIVVFLVGGCIAGVLGFTSLSGLISLVMLTIFLHLALLLLVRMHMERFLLANTLSVFASSISNQALTFILFWTLSFALVHIY